MARDSILRACKDCGVEFYETDIANFSDKTKGKGAASRCEKHRKEYLKKRKNSGLNYINVQRVYPQRDLSPNPLNMTGAGRPDPKNVEYAAIPTVNEGPKYKEAEKFVDEIIEKLEDPHGPRVVGALFPTGYGKSTYLMYRILTEKRR
jgi:hypothetical protein